LSELPGESKDYLRQEMKNIQQYEKSTTILATNRKLMINLFLLRCVQVGISIKDFDRLTI
jgi:hypothetical protein